jgi:hypothetical protein
METRATFYKNPGDPVTYWKCPLCKKETNAEISGTFIQMGPQVIAVVCTDTCKEQSQFLILNTLENHRS